MSAPAPHAQYPHPRAPRRGPGPAGITVIILLAVALVGAGIGWVIHERATSPLGEVTSARTAWVGALRAGHCVRELPVDGELTRVEVVPCAEPHAVEVLAVRTVSESRFPGTSELARTVGGGCEMDRTQADLGLTPVVWTPGEDAWNSGHRLSLCLGALPSGAMTGSFTAGDEVTPG